MKLIEAAGLFLTLLSVCGVIINVTVLCAIASAGLLKPRKSLISWSSDGNIYLLLTFAIFTCTCRMILVAFYWGPSTFMQAEIYGLPTMGAFNKNTSLISLSLYFEAMITQMVIALNRLCDMEEVQLAMQIFSRRFCYGYFISVLVGCCAFQFLFSGPLWRLGAIFYYRCGTLVPLKAESYSEGEEDPFFKYVFRPINIMTIIICTSCYLKIALNSVLHYGQGLHDFALRFRNLRRTLPFIFTFIFFFALYIALETQTIYMQRYPELNIIRSIFAVLDSITLALFPGIMNKTIRQKISSWMIGRISEVHYLSGLSYLKTPTTAKISPSTGVQCVELVRAQQHAYYEKPLL